jgi:hypothetical protein
MALCDRCHLSLVFRFVSSMSAPLGSALLMFIDVDDKRHASRRGIVLASFFRVIMRKVVCKRDRYDG